MVFVSHMISYHCTKFEVVCLSCSGVIEETLQHHKTFEQFCPSLYSSAILPQKHYSSPFLRPSFHLACTWKRFYASFVIPFQTHHFWSYCAPHTPSCIAFLNSHNIRSTNTLRAAWLGWFGDWLYPMPQSSVLELEHAALALAITTLLSILPVCQLPPCLLCHSLNLSPFLIQRLKLYVGHLPLFHSFFVRCHHPIQPAVYDPVLSLKGHLVQC